MNKHGIMFSLSLFVSLVTGCNIKTADGVLKKCQSTLIESDSHAEQIQILIPKLKGARTL